MIQAHQLTKFYGPKAAIQDVSFEVERGEVVGFLGPNAAGKTTTMRILTGFMPPSSGSAQVAGFDCLTDSLQVRQRVGYMPETVPLYPEMRVYDYLDFFGKVRGLDDRDKRVAHVMDVCGIADVAQRLTGQLSKGYRQRVGLAQAILHEPEVLILDEPTVGLDPKQVVQVRDLIKDLAGRSTIILSTHILPEVSQICQRVLIINEGRIVAEDTPANLTRRLQQSEQVLLRVRQPSDELAAKLRAVPDVLAVTPREAGAYEIQCALDTDRRADLAAVVVQGGWDLLELRPVDLTLEDIFLQLTTREEVHA
ncbi:MAG: ABC transporter ATP-binding protein [Chloroflexi bacterium]|nr:ABC transporter ATP-binding protein [Chloroflexota bacterium]MBU1747659.1 ABC transporter ATP-binding protein [Chloroflexota bacterium]MBU1879391.1 ABC transporter ATP-binding protein [Chloroflexota bacterium]